MKKGKDRDMIKNKIKEQLEWLKYIKSDRVMRKSPIVKLKILMGKE